MYRWLVTVRGEKGVLRDAQIAETEEPFHWNIFPKSVTVLNNETLTIELIRDARSENSD